MTEITETDKGKKSAYERWELPMITDELPKSELTLERIKEAGLLTAVQLEAVEQNAYKDGFDKGYVDALKNAKKDIETKLTTLQSLIHHLSEPLEAINEEIENEILRLTMLITRQVINRELKIESNKILQVIQQAKKLLPLSQQHLTISANPQDVKLIEEAMAQDTSRSWEVKPDSGIQTGGCQVNAGPSHIDATVAVQLEHIFAKVLGEQITNEDKAYMAQVAEESKKVEEEPKKDLDNEPSEPTE